MLYESITPVTSSLSLADKLASLPQDRHVTLYKLGESPIWYASFKRQGKQVILCMGQDVKGAIGKWQQEQAKREETSRLRIVVRRENRQKRENWIHSGCKDGHMAPCLTCSSCINRAYAQMLWKRGA